MEPARKSPTLELRPELLPLAKELARLDSEERELVIAMARGGQRPATVPWEEFWKLEGLVRLGGTAVDDCRNSPDE